MDKKILLLAGIAILLLAIPGLANSIISMVTGVPKTCLEAPFDKDCYCPEGYRKVSVPWLGIPRWTCENISALLLDPESPTFEQDAINFVRNYLEKYCYEICDGIECGDMDLCIQGIPPSGKDRCIEAVFGYGKEGKRMVSVECKVVTEWYPDGKPKSGYSLWGMNFYVESETGVPVTNELLARNNFCYNKEEGSICTLPYVCEEKGNPDWCYPYLELELEKPEVPEFPREEGKICNDEELQEWIDTGKTLEDVKRLCEQTIRDKPGNIYTFEFREGEGRWECWLSSRNNYPKNSLIFAVDENLRVVYSDPYTFRKGTIYETFCFPIPG